MIYPILGVIVGILIGLYLPIVPQAYVKLLSVALMAALDSGLGGIRAAKEGCYDNEIFISGFFVNGVLAVFLCYSGIRLGIDLYFVAVLAFGLRIFTNIAIIRRLYLKK
jgi:small basic protein